jgi:hypothetical protein
MRYYDIRISDPDTGKVIVPYPFKSSAVVVTSLPGSTGTPTAAESNQGDTSYTSFPGHHNPNALDIELNVRSIGYGNNAGDTKQGSYVRIYGVSLPEIGQQFKLTNKNIVIKAGMSDGLPLAKREQQGVILSARIWQALGNWEGVDKTLELMLYPANIKPSNYQFLWEKDQLLADAIRTTLAGSDMGASKLVGNISPRLKNNSGRAKGGIYKSFEEFAATILSLSRAPEFADIKTLTGRPYEGVQLFKRPGINATITTVGTPTQPPPAPPVGVTPGGTSSSSDIYMTDKTFAEGDTRTPTKPLELKYEDFIGQPTWIENSVISFKTVMRADIRVADFVKFPEWPFGNLFGVITPGATGGQLYSPSRNNLAFQTSFFIRSVNHIGRFRSPEASSWVTVFEGVFTVKPSDVKTPQELPKAPPPSLPQGVPATPQGPLGGGGV